MRPGVVLSYFQGGIELSLDLVCRRYLNKRKTPQLVVNAMGNLDFFCALDSTDIPKSRLIT